MKDQFKTLKIDNILSFFGEIKSPEKPYVRERYDYSYPPSYGFDSTITVFLQKCLRNWITLEGAV